MNCPHCGALAAANDSFCASCGLPLEAEPPRPSFARATAPAPASSAPSAPAPATPLAAGPDRVFRVALTKVSSFLVVSHKGVRVYTGTPADLERQARSALTHNLLLGWWGFPFGVVWTIMALARNAKSMRQMRALAAAPPR